MVYVALLRGINVGGNRKVEMKQLKSTFEAAGMTRVRTYINSGNVVFEHPSEDSATVAAMLEAAIESEFGFPVKVLIRTGPALLALAQALPDGWANDAASKCDVLFLGEEDDRPDLIEELTVNPGVDNVLYRPGALLWQVDKPLVTRSGLMRIVGTDTYRRMTVRNCNTLRKLAGIVREYESA